VRYIGCGSATVVAPYLTIKVGVRHSCRAKPYFGGLTRTSAGMQDNGASAAGYPKSDVVTIFGPDWTRQAQEFLASDDRVRGGSSQVSLAPIVLTGSPISTSIRIPVESTLCFMGR
jgi:hypothetical protein